MVLKEYGNMGKVLKRIGVLMLLSFTSFAVFGQDHQKKEQSLTVQSEYVFVNDIDDWVLNQLAYNYEADKVTMIGRLRHANRFNTNGTFLSVVAYPEFGETTYAYLMAGTSPDGAAIYPDLRTAAKLYTEIAEGIVIGPGMQYIRTPLKKVYIYSLTTNWYVGNYLIITDPSIQSLSGKQSFSGNVSARKYFDEAESYVSVTVGAGRNPESSIFKDDIFDTFSSIYANTQINFKLNDQWKLLGGLKFRRDQFTGSERTRIGIRAGVTVHF
jgi:YaiO family outer membrane protein